MMSFIFVRISVFSSGELGLDVGLGSVTGGSLGGLWSVAALGEETGYI